MVNECTLFFFVKKEKKELLWFSLFFGFVCQKTEEKRGKEEDAFSTTKRRKRLMTAHFLFTQTHGTNIIIMVFTTVLSTVRVVASSVSRHSLSFSILPRFSLSLSLSARANASRPYEQIIYSAFLSISEKMYYHTQAQQQQPQQQRTKVVSRASAPPTCSLSMRPAHAQTAITDDANADVGCDSKTEMAKTKCVHPERKDKSTWCKDCPRRG
tara:strand:- start:944 stop:1579 length:636 start_codon:yes stop_codon:yes gene_type:complete